MFLVTIPHSGERVPSEASWLQGLPEPVLMCDVDRFVDRLYDPALTSLKIPSVRTEWHRYAADLNRIPEDVDAGSVEGHKNTPGQFNRGFHWTVTTQNQVLMPRPMTLELHQKLVDLIYVPFHKEIQTYYSQFRLAGCQRIFHLDAHSMPSLGTKMHRDPGEQRADIVVSDCHGTSCQARFRDLVIAAYVIAGFRVGYNWPYFGGRLTEQYGLPSAGVDAIQVELNRALYMDEENKTLKVKESQIVSEKINLALKYIQSGLQGIIV